MIGSVKEVFCHGLSAAKAGISYAGICNVAGGSVLCTVKP